MILHTSYLPLSVLSYRPIQNGASNRMVKLLWGPVLILLRTVLQSDPAIPEGRDREAAAAQKSFSQPKECPQIPAHSPRSIQPRTVCSGAKPKPRAVSRKRRRKTASLPYGRKRRKPSTKENNMKIEWILCPFCGSKTRLKIRDDTVLENFPLYCPKCKHETLIAVRQLNLSIIQEPDAKTQSR